MDNNININIITQNEDNLHQGAFSLFNKVCFHLLDLLMNKRFGTYNYRYKTLEYSVFLCSC